MKVAGRYVAMLLIAGWSLVPIVLVVTASFKPAVQIFDLPPRLLFEPTLESYRALWREWPEFFRCLNNSLIVAVGATLLTVSASCLAGYVYSRRRGRGLAASAFFMLMIRMFPPIVITLPLFPVVNYLKLNDTYTILILLYATFFVSLSTWIIKAGIDQLPLELEEAARIDGATLAQSLRLVILPLIAADAGRRQRVHPRVRLERIPVRVHLHYDARQDGAAHPVRDDGFGHRGGLGCGVRRRHDPARAGDGVRDVRAKISGGRPHRRLGEV